METNNEHINIQDMTSDRKYFTLCPNYVTEVCNSIELALYIQYKKMAGEKGIAYPSQKLLSKKLDITINTLKKYIVSLIDKKLISYVGEKEVQTSGGMQRVKCYRMNDIWKLNIEYFEKEYQKLTPPKSKGVSKYGSKVYQNTATNKNTTNKNLDIAEASSARVFSFLEEKKKMEEHERRDLNIIALYMDFRAKSLQPKIKSPLQLSFFIKRHVRSASEIAKAGYEDDQILNAFDDVNKKYKDIDWTLETIAKELTK